jgi:hypothetical protein
MIKGKRTVMQRNIDRKHINIALNKWSKMEEYGENGYKEYPYLGWELIFFENRLFSSHLRRTGLLTSFIMNTSHTRTSTSTKVKPNSTKLHILIIIFLSKRTAALERLTR